MTLSRQLVAKLQALPSAAIPADVREAAKLHLLDAIGVGLAAAATRAGEPYLKAAPALNGGGGAASIFGCAAGFSSATAALANGGMIHALEYDDTHTGSIVHGSSVLASTTLAAAEGVAANGDELLTAYIKGWEVAIRTGLAAPGKFQAQGFQITSVGGALSAALVASMLMRLDETRSVDAIGIALSQASGVFEFLTNGSTVKSLHAGWAAHAGVTAATLAAAGLTGPATAFEGQFGLFRQFARDADAAERFAVGLGTLGDAWHLPQAAFKFYPCCHYIHPFIEALERALEKMPSAAVETIVCEVPPGAALLISEPWDRKLKPESGHEARYSLPIALAAHLIEGAVTPATFADAPSAEIMAKAECISARPMNNAQFPQRFEAQLQVQFANGAATEVYIEDVFGGARRPPSREAVLTKFRTNAAMIRAGDPEALEAAVLSIERQPVAEITRLLRTFQIQRRGAQRGGLRGKDMRFDLVLRNGIVVLPDTDGVAADIAVSGGKIAAILAPGTAVDTAETLDVNGKIVFPGIIDVHLHLGHGKDIARPRVPEDAAGETAAAAVGGVTTFIPYLMATDPFETLFDEVKDVTEAGARIDFGYHFIISTEDQLASVPRYAREYGAPSFKIFMNNRGGEGARLGLPDIDDGFLLRLCEAAAANGGMVCPHPENIEAAWVLRKRVTAEDPDGRGSLRAWNATRPPFIEADAVQRAGLFARKTGARLYIVHTSSREALEAGLRARDTGTDIVIETCPHYLTHDVEWEGGDTGKINPPLREREDRDALWAGILSGDVDTIATDHVHRGISSKAGGIWKASPGCPGLETLLPVMLTEGHHERGISLGHIAMLLSTTPADAMGLRHRKGRIAVGLDADLAVVDLNREHVYRREDVRSSAGYSIYEGRQFKGKVVHTLVRGQFAVRDGTLIDDAVGGGRYIGRSL